MIPKHRICTFSFSNGTFITVAVPMLVTDLKEVRERTFFEYLHTAKELGWSGNEEHGRGRLTGFELGRPIYLP